MVSVEATLENPKEDAALADIVDLPTPLLPETTNSRGLLIAALSVGST